MSSPGDSIPKKKHFPVRLPSLSAVSTPRTATGGDSGRGGSAKNSRGTALPGRGVASSQSVGLDSPRVRARMVERLRALGIRSLGVLAAMEAVPRHLFVDSALVNQAYEDTSLPIGLGQTISKPSVVARMIELIEPADGGPMGRILDIGTGCGYQAVVLARLAREVYSIERLQALHERARANLRPLRIANVHLIHGDGMQGFATGAPYDAIIAAAGGESVPQAWLDQLAIGGRLVAPVAGPSGVQSLLKVERSENGYVRHVLETVQFVPLKSGVA